MNMQSRGFITPLEAAKRACIAAPSTIRYWCERYGIGRKVAGRWRIDPVRLDALLRGEGVNHDPEN
tara:strand:- start:232 stop:429 length:198 start_codon:yes stop_codon:yes gene_type:complete